MGIVKFNAMCRAVYEAELEIPDELCGNEEDVCRYIRENINDVPVNNLEYFDDEVEDVINTYGIISVEVDKKPKPIVASEMLDNLRGLCSNLMYEKVKFRRYNFLDALDIRELHCILIELENNNKPCYVSERCQKALDMIGVKID